LASMSRSFAQLQNIEIGKYYSHNFNTILVFQLYTTRKIQ